MLKRLLALTQKSNVCTECWGDGHNYQVHARVPNQDTRIKRTTCTSCNGSGTHKVEG